MGMSVIFEIDRDFPYQVALSFDEIAMEVLAWLDERSFGWDMYVDMPKGAAGGGGNCRRRELTAAGRNRSCFRRGSASRGGYNAELRGYLSRPDALLFEATHSITTASGFTYCFKEQSDAQKFIDEFGAAPMGRRGKNSACRTGAFPSLPPSAKLLA